MARILVVEDEALVALLIEETLREAGFQIAGCTDSPDKALAILDECDCDAAVLDATLHGKSVEPVATALHRRGMPFVFISGYSRIQLHEQFIDAPLLSKPFKPEHLIRTIKRILP